MTRQGTDHDVVRAFQRLTNAADDFVNRAPRAKRIEAERAALLDAITHAELVLSVHRLAHREQELEPDTRSKLTPVPEARNKTMKRRSMN